MRKKHFKPEKKARANYSLGYDFGLFFKKIEFASFFFLSVAVIVTSKLNADFSKNISEKFINISIPIVETASFPFNATVNLLTNFQDLVEARKENIALKVENTQLKALYVNSLHIRNENEHLRKLLGFVSSKMAENKITARVTARSHQLFSQTIYLDIGHNQHVQEGSIVVGNLGAIGRVAQVFADKSRLILATNANSRIPIIASNARVKGILAGNNSSVMKVLYLQKDHGIIVGDRIFTSGDGDQLPAGILIGTVTKVDKENVSVKLVENIANMDLVTILDY